MGLGTAWPFYCGSNPKCISGQQDEAKRRIEEAARCATTGRSTRAEAQMGHVLGTASRIQALGVARSKNGPERGLTSSGRSWLVVAGVGFEPT